jgi:hypothetical protein
MTDELERTRPRRVLDLLLTLLAIAFGIFSLGFPLGRDQGLYYYVGREWALHGSIPYRDVLDHKTPGIYVVHALAVHLFGDRIWGYRVFELLIVAGLGLIAASLTRPSPRPGVRGASILAAFVLYWGFFDFWNTGQSEVWYSTIGLGAIAAAVRIKDLRRAAVIAGAVAGAALVMKPPSIFFGVTALVIVALRYVKAASDATSGAQADATSDVAKAAHRRVMLSRVVRATVFFGAGVAIPALLVIVYFGAHHALGAMADIVGGANSYYVTHEGNQRDPIAIMSCTLDVFRLYNPISAVAAIASIAAFVHDRRTKNREGVLRWYIAAAALLAGWIAVTMQGKFYLLHWGAMLAPSALVASLLIDRACDVMEKRRPSAFAGAGVVASVVLMLGLFCFTGISVERWYNVNVSTIAYLRGKESRGQFTDQFNAAGIGFWFHDSEDVGRWLEEHTTPEDFVGVRGFQPEIYAVAHRRYPGRFFWTTFITSPQRAYRRAEWLAEDHEALVAHPPKYVVTLTGIHEGPDSSEWFTPLGYTERLVVRNFTIMEHVAPAK